MPEWGQQWGKLGLPPPHPLTERQGKLASSGDYLMERETEGLRGVKGHNRTKITETERAVVDTVKAVGQLKREPT